MSTQIKITIPNDNNNKQQSINALKNINRLNSVIINQCGKRCFSNLLSDKLDKIENECIITCIKKYYNTLDIGDKVYDLFTNKYINSTDLLRGNYENIVNKLNSSILN